MDLSSAGARRRQQQLVSKAGRTKRKVLTSGFKILLVGIVLFIIACAGVGFGMIKGIIDEAPDVKSINIQPKGFKSTIYDQNGNVVTTLSTINSNRIYVYYDEIPKQFVNAFVAVEDERFWNHNGIDVRGIFRVFVTGATSGNFNQGASTLTQQLIKNHVFNVGMNETTFMEKLQRKFQEQYLAIELEKIYSKEEICEYYLNTIYLGQGVHGIEAASERYFNKKIGELTVSEMAVIAGITQNPYKYDPVNFPENNKTKRKLVLNKMLEQEYITQAEYDACLLDDVYSRIEQVKILREENSKINSYYIDAIMVDLRNYFRKVNPGMTSAEAYQEIYTGGYSIYSVQDMKIQQICDETINNSAYYPDGSKVSLSYALSIIDKSGKEKNYGINSLIAYYKNTTNNLKYNSIYPSEALARAAAATYKEYVIESTGGTVTAEKISCSIQPQATFVVMDQHTGYVKAITSGRGEKTANLGLNRATQSTRQPGSTFKILAAFLPLIDTGGSLATCFDDAPYTYANGVSVRNWYGSYRGPSSIRQAIENSMNIIAVKCITQVTPEVAYTYLENLGFTTLADGTPDKNGNVYSDKTQACATGGLTYGITNLEITAAYAAIANGGVYTKPCYYSKVLDHNGNVVIDNTDTASIQHTAMKATTAWQLIEGMKDVVNTGTGKVAKMTSGVTCAGKTGTTSSNYDLWFCGMTPYYTASVWYGYDSNTDIGSSTNHKKLWRDIMDKIAIMEEQPKGGEIMEKPEGITKISVCKLSGLKPQTGCPVNTDWGAEGAGPTEVCKGHQFAAGIDICMDSHEIATENCTNVMHYEVAYDENNKMYIVGATFTYTQAIFKSSCTLHPVIEGGEITISTSCGEGGTISQSVTITAGSSVTIYITPLAGYTISDVKVDGGSVGAVTSFTFTNITESHTISATFSGGGGGGGETPTEPPTEKPTEPPTEKPTEPPTEKPTEPPTEAPTEPPTEAPQPEGE